MLSYSTKYLYHCLQIIIAAFGLLMIFSTTAYSQNTPLQKDSLLPTSFNPLFFTAYKKPARLMISQTSATPYTKYALKTGGELMHWPSYPLTTGQIIARNEEWQRRNNNNVGEQIASDIIKSNVNKLIYGRKTAAATIPKF